jgi:hypothetical protein
MMLGDGWRFEPALRRSRRTSRDAPALAVGDGALAFSKALRDVFLEPPSIAAGGTR